MTNPGELACECGWPLMMRPNGWAILTPSPHVCRLFCGQETAGGWACRNPGPGPCWLHGGAPRASDEVRRAKREDMKRRHDREIRDRERAAYEWMWRNRDAAQRRSALIRWLTEGGGGDAFAAFADRLVAE